MWLAVTLAPHQDALRRLLSGLAELAPAVAALGSIPAAWRWSAIAVTHLAPVRELAEALLCEAEKVDLVRWILEVDEDVLGVYEYGSFDFGPDACIGLHWGVIGVCAGGLGVPVEDLAARRPGARAGARLHAPRPGHRRSRAGRCRPSATATMR